MPTNEQNMSVESEIEKRCKELLGLIQIRLGKAQDLWPPAKPLKEEDVALLQALRKRALVAIRLRRALDKDTARGGMVKRGEAQRRFDYLQAIAEIQTIASDL